MNTIIYLLLLVERFLFLLVNILLRPSGRHHNHKCLILGGQLAALAVQRYNLFIIICIYIYYIDSAWPQYHSTWPLFWNIA